MINMAVLIDSYSETNQDISTNLRNGSTRAVGQVFTIVGSYTLTSCKFYLQKLGSPTGNVTAYLYAATGTVGTDAVGTGSPIATSSAIDITTISTSVALVTFTFTNPYDMVNGTSYAIVCEFLGGDASNALIIYYDNSSPTHAGNKALINASSAWFASATQDSCFYIYGNYLDVMSKSIYLKQGFQ